MKIIKVTISGLGVAMALACHSTGFAPPTTTTGADIDTTPNERALRELISERCMHEVNCGDVGKGHVDSSYDACVSRTRPPTRDALLSHGCDKAIDDTLLRQCVNALRKEVCGGPSQPITDVTPCGTADLCQ